MKLGGEQATSVAEALLRQAIDSARAGRPSSAEELEARRELLMELVNSSATRKAAAVAEEAAAAAEEAAAEAEGVAQAAAAAGLAGAEAGKGQAAGRGRAGLST